MFDTPEEADNYPWNDDYGIQYVGIEQFLTNESILS